MNISNLTILSQYIQVKIVEYSVNLKRMDRFDMNTSCKKLKLIKHNKKIK